MRGPVSAEYSAVLQRLEQALRFGMHPSLDGIRALTEALGRPQDSFRCIQVTGTNGKTSVTRIAGALLLGCGYKVGVYTSPHLVSYTERVEVGGEPVSQQAFASAMNEVFEVADSLDGAFTEFELLTAGAFVMFRNARVEWACLEVGMGGRWDATSIVHPTVAVITGVALDHTAQLGSTREAIAAEKAQIIKQGCTAVIGPGCEGVDDIIMKRVKEVGAQPVFVRASGGDITWHVTRRPHTPGGTLVVDIDGVREVKGLRLHAPSYQAPNIACALAAVGTSLWTVFDVSTISRSLKTLKFPGRFEVMRRNPALILDGAHNPEAALVLADAIAETFGEVKPVIVLGVLADKDAGGIVRALAPVASAFITAKNSSPRAMPAGDLAGLVATVTGVRALACEDVASAWSEAAKTGRDVVITGSLYTVGDAKALLG